ncbi:hypothetical protein BJX66DRAFT_333826 [Aspergillus keveii]|uniref:Uncharacterized protein n=1 Tax=Aspergillus keveii TaxID=714993 RepID=A0ABR4GIA6_9EURO
MSKPLSFKSNAIDLPSTTPEYFTVNMVPKPRPSSRPHSTCISRAPSPATVSAAVSALPISDSEPSDNKVYIPLCFCLISFAVMECLTKADNRQHSNTSSLLLNPPRLHHTISLQQSAGHEIEAPADWESCFSAAPFLSSPPLYNPDTTQRVMESVYTIATQKSLQQRALSPQVAKLYRHNVVQTIAQTTGSDKARLRVTNGTKDLRRTSWGTSAAE